MKIKILILTLGLIITMISGVKIKDFNTANNVQDNKIITADENLIANEIAIAQEEQIEEELNQEQEQEENVKVNENTEEQENTNTVKENTEVQKEVPKTNSSQSTFTTKKETSKNTQDEPTVKQETTNVEETPKEETQVTKTPTESDLEYWCVAGGEHHIAGDGENEHGYYSSWDEAYNAFENYTKGWASVQFKISQCSCGLFYFWAIK